MFRQAIAAVERLTNALDRNTAALNRLHGEEKNIMSAFDNLKAAVAAQTTVDQSAVALIQGIADKLKTTTTDADVQALADELTAAAAPLSAAITANTPATPAPVAASAAPASATTSL
jgi:predicted PP-loop superfamily ATPase